MTPNFAQGQSRDQMLMPAQPAFSNQIYSNPQIPGIAQPYAYAGLPSYGLSMIPQSMAAYHQSMSNLHLQQMGGPSSMPASVYQQTRYVSPQIQAMMQSRPGLQSASSQSPRPGLMSQHMRSQLASWPTPASPQILQRQGSSEAPQVRPRHAALINFLFSPRFPHPGREAVALCHPRVAPFTHCQSNCEP